jgi:cellulose synthase/poly-beta-1,6-N-acetylglucosamine synthase-like glycosyltransferase
MSLISGSSTIINVAQVILFTSILLIFYTYVIFPSILHALSFLKSPLKLKNTNSGISPGVSIIIAVYNEEKVIREKIESILASNYPKENMEILIGSDASNDGTSVIINSIVSNYPCIRYYEFEERRGKPSVINDLVKYAANSLILLTDANVFFEREMLGLITRHFTDERIGLVGSNILNVGMKKDGISVQEKSYIERENLIKYREGNLWGCMMGPFGGCYILRKNLFKEVPSDFLVDDFYISMKILEKGFYCINDLQAICYEDVSNDIRQEYRRKSRISAGNFQNLKTFRKFLMRPFSPAGFCFISHKILRWLTPFFIIFSLLSLFILSSIHPFYLLLFAGEVLLLCTPFFDWLAGKAGLHIRLLRFVSYFTYMNLALLKGFFRFAGGIRSGVWTPTKRV